MSDNFQPCSNLSFIKKTPENDHPETVSEKESNSDNRQESSFLNFGLRQSFSEKICSRLDTKSSSSNPCHTALSKKPFCKRRLKEEPTRFKRDKNTSFSLFLCDDNTPKKCKRLDTCRFSSSKGIGHCQLISQEFDFQSRTKEFFMKSINTGKEINPIPNFQTLHENPWKSSFHNRRNDSSEVFFKSEFKSLRFFQNLQPEEFNCNRNILQSEINTNAPYIDTHCHLDFLFKRLHFNDSMDQYMDKTFFKFPTNFEGCIADWCQPSLFRTASTILKEGNDKLKLWAAFGCHPHFVQDYTEVSQEIIEGFIDGHDQVVAWGEIGLDYSDRFGPTDHKLQKEVFSKQLDRACRRNIPLVIHCRDADHDLIKIMKSRVPHNTKIHRHCLTTEEKEVQGLLSYFPNCYVGFTNIITNHSAYKARSAALTIPLERIVLETDAPYFIPRCILKASDGSARWSHPGMASSVGCELARIKQLELDEVLETIRDNVRNLYGI